MWFLSSKGPSGFCSSSTAEEVTQGIDGTGLTAIVTGASSGIGAETARVLALRNVHVVMAVRNADAGKNVKETILKEIPSAKIDVMELDLTSTASIRKFASEYKASGLPLNLLINNAGVVVHPSKLSQENIELQFATNHLGHFLLTNLLLEIMKSTAQNGKKEGRIINLSSEAHRMVSREGICFDKLNYASSWYGYGESKLANILHANELAKHLKVLNIQDFNCHVLDCFQVESQTGVWQEGGVEITANSVNPGTVYTNLMRHQSFLNVFFNLIGKYLIKNVQQGAATTCYVALHPQVKGVSGEYFSGCNIGKPSYQAKDVELAKKLWDFSLSFTNAR